jgi:signal recognition particle receptor subunit beta
MGSYTNSRRDDAIQPVKIMIAGGFGVGKTTFVSTTSEIVPLTTEEEMTVASMDTDDLSGVEIKKTTTVAFDFGRITLGDGITLYLFGAPGQNRFVRFWSALSANAIGAVVLLDTRRIADGFPSIDFFEAKNIPYVVAVNCFDGSYRYEPQEVRETATVPEDVPVLLCDARDRQSCKEVLITLVQCAFDRLRGQSLSQSRGLAR